MISMRCLREQTAKLSRGNDLAKAMEYMLKRWAAFTRFLDDGRICLSTDGVEKRELSGCDLSTQLRFGASRGLAALSSTRQPCAVGLLGASHVVILARGFR